MNDDEIFPIEASAGALLAINNFLIGLENQKSEKEKMEFAICFAAFINAQTDFFEIGEKEIADIRELGAKLNEIAPETIKNLTE